jgi:hypothetical protein
VAGKIGPANAVKRRFLPVSPAYLRCPIDQDLCDDERKAPGSRQFSIWFGPAIALIPRPCFLIAVNLLDTVRLRRTDHSGRLW